MKQIIPLLPLLPLLLLLRGVAADINETQNIEQSQRHYLQRHRENVAEEVGERDINRSLANPPGINNNRGSKPGIIRQHKRGNAPGINRNQSSSVSHHRGANKRNIVRQQNRKNNIQYKRHKKRGNAYRNSNNSNGRGRGGIKKKNQMRNRYGSISVEKNSVKPPPSPPIQDLTSNTSGKKPMLSYPPQKGWFRPPPNSWSPPPPPLPQRVWGESLEVEGEDSVSSKSYKQRGKGKSGKDRGVSESVDVNTNIGWQQYSPPPSWKKPSWSSINWNRWDTPPTQWISPTTWGKPPQYHPSNSSWKPPPKMEPKPISWEPQQELEAGTTSRYTSPSGIKMCPCENKPKMPLPQPPNKMMPYSTKNTAKDPSNPILSGGKAESHANAFVNNNKKDIKEFKKHIRESGGTRQEVKDYESNGDSMRLLSNWGGPSHINGIPLLCPCKTQPPTAVSTTYMPTIMEPEEIPEPPSTYFPTWSPTTEATTNKPSPKATTMFFPSFSPTYSLPTFSPSDLETDKPVKPVDTMIPTYSPTSAYPTFSPSVSEEEVENITTSDEPTVQPSVSPIADEVETTEPSISPITTVSLPTYSPTYKWPTYAPTGATTTSFSPTTSSIPSTSSPTSTSSPSYGPSLLSEDTSDTPSFIDTPSPILSMTPPPTSGTNSTEETTMSPTVRDSTAPTITPFPTTSSGPPQVANSLTNTNSPSSLVTPPSDATQSTSPSVSTIGTASPSLLSYTQSPSVTFSTSSKSQTCPDELIQSYNINSESTLYYAMVPSSPLESSNGILCARLEVNNDNGWIGVGFSPSGTMENSQAVIGIYDEDTVLKYDLAPGQATQMSDDKQTLQKASITTMDGKTIMEFTKLLVEDDEVEILEEGENIFLHAWGGSALVYHEGRLSFTIDFSEDNNEDTSRPIPPPIEEATNSPVLALTPPPVTDSTIELVGQLSSTEAPSSWYPTYYPTNSPH